MYYKIFVTSNYGCFFLRVLTGNLDWVGNEFTLNAGAGLVITQPEGNSTVVEQLRAAFERDWFSRYTRSLQPNKIPVCNKHQINRMAPMKTGHLDNVPAPMRNSRTDDEQVLPKTRHHDDKRLSKITLHGIHNDLAPIINGHHDRGRVKMSRPDNGHVQIQNNYRDNPMDPPGQSAESSGSREIANSSL